MSQDIGDFLTADQELLALGEPNHTEPAFGRVRNELFAQLVEHGFRSIALETDRVAALAVDDFVRDGIGTLDAVLRDGFTHNFGDLESNRELVAWMREHNRNRPPEQRLTFHGFDIQTENTTAPSPRTYLEHARDHLGLDVDIAGPAGDDERWHREEAILDPASSVGDSADARRLRTIGLELLAALDAREAEGVRARIHLTAGLGLLRYHKEAARPLTEQMERMRRLLAVRDGLMAQNLLDIRAIEADRGPTFVGAANAHLQKDASTFHMPERDVTWIGAGAIVAALWGERYAFVAGTLGRSEKIGVGDPEPDTYEGKAQRLVGDWGLIRPELVDGGEVRGGVPWGYFPLEPTMVDQADAIMHIGDAAAIRAGRSTAD